MNVTVNTSKGPVRFHSVGEPIVGRTEPMYRHITSNGEYSEFQSVYASPEAYVAAIRNAYGSLRGVTLVCYICDKPMHRMAKPGVMIHGACK